MADNPNPPNPPAPAPSSGPSPEKPAEGAAAAKPAETPKVLTAEEKQARLAAARAANAAKAAAAKGGVPAPAPAAGAATPPAPAAPKPASAPAPAGAAVAAKPFPPKADAAKDSGVEASGAPANKPAAAHLATAAAKPGAAATKTKGAEVPLPPPPQLQTRRTFIEWSFAAWLVFFAWLAGVGHMFLRFMFPNVLYESDPRFVAGKKSDFPEAPKVYENFKQAQAVWIVRLPEEGQDRLVALSTVCTHLGCTPNWLDAEQKYKCPCHGSGYYINGVNFEGPTPRPLERFRIFFDAAGNIVIDKAKKYRQDLGQWNENESFVIMS